MSKLPNREEVVITGHTYPLPLGRQILSKVLSMAFLVAMGSSLLASQLTFLPAEIRGFLEAKRGMIIGAGFLMNMLSSSIQQTGAFEVYIDKTLVYSKLKEGTPPTVQQMVDMILQKTVIEPYGQG